MSDNWHLLKCNFCSDEFLTTDSYIDDFGIRCKCGCKMVYTKDFKAEHYLQIIEMELENVNYHSMISIPRSLYNASVNEENVDLARKIAQTFYDFI